MTDRQQKSTTWKVLGLYAAGSWVVLQAIDVLADNIGLPSWVFTSALVLLIIGLPIVGDYDKALSVEPLVRHAGESVEMNWVDTGHVVLRAEDTERLVAWLVEVMR